MIFYCHFHQYLMFFLDIIFRNDNLVFDFFIKQNQNNEHLDRQVCSPGVFLVQWFSAFCVELHVFFL